MNSWIASGMNLDFFMDLLHLGVADVENVSGCYSCIVATSMEQAPFIVFMDEYNTYFEKGEYFHEAYN